MKNVKSAIKYILIGFLGLIALLLVWGIAIEPRLIDETEETVHLPGLPQSWDGKRIALIADMQVGMWFNNTDTIKRVAERLAAERPAAVLIAGDFIYKPTKEETLEEVKEEFDAEEDAEARDEIRKVVAIMRQMTAAGVPVYAVLGNHDYAMMTPKDVKLEWIAQELEKELAAAGVRVLQNEAVPMRLENTADAPPTSETLYLVGVGSKYAGRADPAKALASLPENAPRVVLMHNPESFAELPADSAPLALAGHTHGGQIRVPFLEDWTWMQIVSDREIHADGWIEGYGQAGNRLYVNRGIGFSKFPIRINCSPEITFVTLKRAQ